MLHRRSLLAVTLAIVGTLYAAFLPAQAAAIGKATADFDNAQPKKAETAWGRLAADAVRAAAHSDIALISAGALQSGTLRAGSIETAHIDALLAFGDDPVVTLTITGTQLRAALEIAASAYPTGSAAFLHCSGLTAAFNSNAERSHRVTSVRVQGREVGNDTTLTAAMPSSLAQGGEGYFRIWKGDGAQRSGATLRSAITDYIRSHGQVSPDGTARFAPQ